MIKQLVTGLCAGRLQSGRFRWGSGDERSAIVAVILGGTSVFGGAGSVTGTLLAPCSSD